MQSISDAVPAALAALLERQPLSPAKVDFAWRVAVGPAVARATHVALDTEGALVVTTTDRHWTREVESARPLVLARLARLLGPNVVSRIVVRGPSASRRQRQR
jgi:predicted nucleic acid-binding Zn ribbon protein